MTEEKLKTVLQDYNANSLGKRGFWTDNQIDDYIKHYGHKFCDTPKFKKVGMVVEEGMPEPVAPKKSELPDVLISSGLDGQTMYSKIKATGNYKKYRLPYDDREGGV